MAAHKEIEQNHAAEFSITASAPMATAPLHMAATRSDRPVVSLVINPARSADEKTGIRSLFLSFDLSELADFIDQRNDVSRNSGKYVSCSALVGRNGLVLASSDHSLVGMDYSAVKKTLGRKFLIIERKVDARSLGREITLLVLAALVTAVPALAQQPGTVEVGLFFRDWLWGHDTQIEDWVGFGGRAGYFFLPNYPTLVAAINFDRTGTTRIGKYVLNHSFQLPGMAATITAVVTGLVLGKILM